ncbi:unnamed protein product, partial [Mesorhabditis belari]|uniref:Urocanate hydratase n=1 Tax=Mesorhabditis belari TaxID=2138241 RepID=A0AAF3FN83_9BILA
MKEFPVEALPLLLKLNIFELLSTNEKVLIRGINSGTKDLVNKVGLLPRKIGQAHLSGTQNQVKIRLWNSRDGHFAISFSRNTEGTEEKIKITHSQLFGGNKDFLIAEDFDERFVIFQLTKTIRPRLLRVHTFPIENPYQNVTLFNSDLLNFSTLLQNSGAAIFVFNCIRNLQKLINRVEIKSTLGLKWIVDEWRCWCYEKCKKCPAGMSQFLALTSASSFVFIETMRNQETPNEISDKDFVNFVLPRLPEPIPLGIEYRNRQQRLNVFPRANPFPNDPPPPALPPLLRKNAKLGIFPVKDVLEILETFAVQSSTFMKKRIYALELEPKTIETFNAIISAVHFTGNPQYYGNYWAYLLDSEHYRSDRALLFQGFDTVFVTENFNGDFLSIISQITAQFRQFPFRMPCGIEGLLSDPFEGLPDYPSKWRNLSNISHAPRRPLQLNANEKKLSVANALRYVPEKYHNLLAKEFAEELETYGHIYAFRFMPDFPLKAPPIHEIKAKCQQAAAIILMIMNNLDPEVAQFPQELVTYGGNGQVFSNWIQFRLVIRYLWSMSDEQTLVMYSGHPLGLFPSHKDAPRLTITNGMMIPNYSTKPLYDKYFALGVTMYGQMTAGSYCYIGPQGIVHGTTITVMNAGRKYLNTDDLAGKVFVTAGLGGMSGAQAKAAKIAGCVGVIAEISEKALKKRHDQGWLEIYSTNLDEIVGLIKEARSERKAISIGYLGNVVDLCLRRQIAAIDKLAKRGMYFWDYGNAFLVECQRAGVEMLKENAKDDKDFRYPSYFQDIMGDIFSMGFGPFRWVCTSGTPEDLKESDKIACQVINKLLKGDMPEWVKQQYVDNRKWIVEADEHKLVVGTQARILYSDQAGRTAIALAFNEAVRNKRITAPIVISRDHHDVSGTDSPFRETANITDGSAFTADMAVQNAIGDAMRGATWISLHNGGGVGWGDVINGGFGMVLDGDLETDRRARSMLSWDVSNGVARRSWSGNDKAKEAIIRTQKTVSGLEVTVPYQVDQELLQNFFN